ncbi:TonB-dependent siderophore receptor [Novacetimonas hansenii]|uniref:TonB-dependent siderophore receptor n=1 Tax=Novacetimonas hansenii TaxID=436 RepID=UPI001CE17A45|nr:TonB-dependent siderophore receptor [Novacetimonas hansenii]
MTWCAVELCPSPAMAQGTVVPVAAQTLSVNIPAGELNHALLTLSQTAHLQIFYDMDKVKGLHANSVSGTMTADQALSRMLSGSGYSFSRTGNKISLVKASANITLGPVRVGGIIAHQDPTGPGVGYVAANTMAGTKTDTPITEIPNSIYVITKQQILDQQPQSLQDALKYTAGVYAGAFGTASNGSNTRQARAIMQRGFNSTQFVDGLLTNTQSSGEPSFLERIEAINGPTSVMYGKLTPGGMIAETLKKPTESPLHEATLGFGNWGRYQATFDISDKITNSGSVRYRIAAIGVTQGSQTDHISYHRVGVLPSIAWDIDKNTSLTLIGSYMYTPGDGTNSGYYPLHGTLITDGYRKISRRNYFGIPNWNTQSERDAMFEYQFHHKFNRYINFSQVFRYENSNYNAKNIYYNGTGGPNTIYVKPNWWIQTYETVALDTRLDGKLKTGPLQHTWVVGTDFQQYHYTLPWWQDYTQGTSGVPVNIYNPNPIYTPCYSTVASAHCVGIRSFARNNYFQEGVYFQDQIKWKRLSVLLGSRQDWVNYKSYSTSTRFSNAGNQSIAISSGSSPAPEPQSAFTWRAGIIYNFDFGLTPYFSYGTSFIPQYSTNYQGQPFAPLKGRQLEAGLKYKVPNKDIILTAAAFRIDEDHYLIQDAVHTNFSSDAGRVRSQGFEVSANANITKDLRFIASYSYTDVRYATTNQTAKRFNPYTGARYGAAISQSGMSVPYVPRNMASGFFDYTFPKNVFDGFGVNWGARYVGFTYIDSVESFKSPAYVLFDVGAHYDFGKALSSLKGLKAQLAISNLTNKYYTASCSTSSCYLGQGRRVYGNLTYNW